MNRLWIGLILLIGLIGWVGLPAQASRIPPSNASRAADGAAVAKAPRTARELGPKSRRQDRSARSGKSKIPVFSYRDPAKGGYLGFRPNTDPARHTDEEVEERYVYSPLAGRERLWRDADNLRIQMNYQRQGTPLRQQIQDVLTYIPITITED
jgi:hypothetical protein